ncbi:type I restriction enzyme HsdR N-terminal domain-containing protein [Fimbriimonas ginsengisoli]|nr:type I restriction enzyme HsdR N-terminal domain-containing protein [Fimbriimonas ginsengisoli]
MNRQDIQRELAEIKEENATLGAPENESNTCDHVILPLLKSMGYSRRDICSRSPDAAGKFPDYTLLPESAHTWFLEAKSWKERLHPRDVDQAINYAHRQGKRWVVLTNGREWRLYDDQIPNVSNEDRLVAEASIKDESEFTDLLEALSKANVLSGAIERSVVATQLRSVLEGQLTQKDSEVVKAVTRAVQKMPGMQSVKSSDIAAYFGQRALAPIKQTKDREPAEAPEPKLVEATTQIRPTKVVGLTATHRGTKPVRLIFSPGDELEVTTWKAVAREIISRLVNAGSPPPIPYRIGRSKGFFLAEEGSTMREPMKFGELAMESHFSADDLMRNTIAVCDSVQFDWSAIRIEVVQP